ncbi:MAG: 2Fe-2S iron-sulfur cluster-binding protein [Pedobacter sp.]|uniref:2Fe-2S iron-sulfur cluster-binding protein n=1 Tax=Pedobacter sp. TaxID=1411316 RepID=UPI002806AF35|nr:2Fe-2S iron-sulfur cluster-binding protein [Pedobacter sp.]MDQ8006121.1 2Fe-2S iron-sulfur cluster-binding protein [Pedobacter sp.]
MSDINITVEDREGNVAELLAPTDMGLSLMEFLKASEYDVLATCGGMALCATCCVDVIQGEEKLNEMSDDEYAMLDTLPDLLPNSRLACQIQLSPAMEGLSVRLHAEQ